MTTASDRTWASVDGLVGPAAHAKLPLDHGLLRGDGCFETALVDEGRVVALELHLARLAGSLAALRIRPPTHIAPLIDDLSGDVARLLESARPTQGVLRLTATAGLRLVELSPLPDRVLVRRRGLDLHSLPEPRPDTLMARHKTLAWSTHAIAMRLHPSGTEPTFEGLWLDPAGRLLEGTATNLFALVDGVAITPPLTQPLLPGTARARALDALPTLGIQTLEWALTPAMLRSGTAFATSALVLVAPVRSYDGTPLAPPPDTLVTALREALRTR